MNKSDSTNGQSPFHEGELRIQERLGVKDHMDQVGKKVIREYMPEQHRKFFAKLSYLLVGTLDESGNPWASILVGESGFISTPDDRTLGVNTPLLSGDPLQRNLADGVDIGILGIELHTRRRNRMNGIVRNLNEEGFTIEVQQSFGNCPKYIQARQFELSDFDVTTPKPIHHLTELSDPEKQIISNGDTFFIATAYQSSSERKASGVDVSHRGGKKGFVHIQGDRTLIVPDYIGNNFFNTFGNLEVNPRAGLLFVDFEKGDLLYLTGTAKVIWESDEIAKYEGAQRLLCFEVESGYRVEGSLPISWSEADVSPFLNFSDSES